MALDEAKDVNNTGQLLLIREVNDEFKVTEELPSMNNLCGTNTSKNIFKEVEKISTT